MEPATTRFETRPQLTLMFTGKIECFLWKEIFAPERPNKPPFVPYMIVKRLLMK